MSGFLGRHECQIDSKGRVSFPSPFRRTVTSGPLVVLQWQSSHLDLFPAESWQEIQKNLLAYRRSGAMGAAYVRRIVASAVEVEPDAHGRIRLPTWLREAVGLEEAVLFVGALDRIELWNPASFNALPPPEGESDEFARQIFG